MSNPDSRNIQDAASHDAAPASALTLALVEIVSRLRGPGGCPWDQEQTHRTLARYATEEAFEMVEALEERELARTKGERVEDPTHPLTFKFKDELGDVLFQVLLHAQLAAEEKAFDFADVVRQLSEKLVRRHPHVFSGMNVDGTEDVIKHWEVIKRNEKTARGEKPSAISVPVQLPALQRAFAIGQKTHKLKFDWQGPADVWLKVKEEIDELQEAMDNDVMTEIEHELGDVLFSVAQLARHYGLEPEQTLRTANNRFLNRFQTMVSVFEETTTGESDSVDDILKRFGELSTEEKEKFWELAKKRHETQTPPK
jgi:tetrapyrrole methylase family protein/MazG family protein